MIEWSTVLLGSILILLTTIFYYLLERDKNPRHVQFAKQFPGPRSLPFIGNGWDFKGNGQDLYAKFLGYMKKYQSPFRLWFGSHLMIVLSEPDDLEMVFGSSKVLGRPELFRSFQDVFGHSIFTEHDSSIWKIDRRIMQVPLAPNAVNAYVPHMNEELQTVVEKFSKHLGGEEFVTSKYFSQMSFDIITKSLLNIKLKPDDKTGELFHYAGHRAMELSFSQMIKPWLRFKFCKYNIIKEASYLRNIMFSFAKKVSDEKIPEMEHEVEERRRKIEEGNNEDTPKTMLNVWYEISKGGKDMEKMYGEIITLIIGGTDTLSTMLEFVFLILGIHQDIQDRVYEEIYEIFGDSDRDADEHDVKNMPYLEQVVKETLRRFTLVPFLFRVVEKDCKIGKHVYPAGTGLMIFPFGTHFNPKYYPDPFKFNPENFSVEAIENRPKYTFLPFGAGVRKCIGGPFALLELKLIVCGLLRKYKFFCNMKFDDIKLQVGFVVTKVDEYKVSIKRRGAKDNYVMKQEHT